MPAWSLLAVSNAILSYFFKPHPVRHSTQKIAKFQISSPQVKRGKMTR